MKGLSSYRKRQLLITIASLITISTLLADPTYSPLPSDQQALALQPGRFKSLNSLRQIPADVIRACFPNQTPADPGKPWNQGDVVRDRTLPFTRVRWVATDGLHWIFSWEHGGKSYSNGFEIVEKQGETPPKVVWEAGRAQKELTTFKEFQSSVRSGGLFSTTIYFRP